MSNSPRPTGLVSLARDGIGHVGLKVSDVERSRSFYSKILGLASETRRPGVALVRCGSDALVIYEHTGDSHFGFRLESPSLVDEWKSWIESNNITIYDDIVEEGHPRGFKFKDPDGHLIEISAKTE
jgi:catechol 2,3-dioxygenase-like lactoylglutathione lyase family enzyme